MKCNKLIQIRKYSKSQHLGIGKRPFFFFGKLIIGGMEAWRVGIKMLVKKFRKNNNRGGGGGGGGGDSRVLVMVEKCRTVLIGIVYVKPY